MGYTYYTPNLIIFISLSLERFYALSLKRSGLFTVLLDYVFVFTVVCSLPVPYL